MLWKKMIRDILSNKGSYLACLVLILIGLVVFTSFSIVRDNLSMAQESFYKNQNFAHGFIELESMPQRNAAGLSQIDGIKDINGRIVKEVQLYEPLREESIYLKLVALDLREPRIVNEMLLLEGEELTAGELKVWVDNQFFEANRLELYQDLEIIAGGALKRLALAGVGMSPEFTYPLRDQKELYPNPEQFGIAFLSLEDMNTLFPETRGMVNDLVFTLEPGTDFERVKNELEPRLEQYGLKTIYPREDQTSHLILSEEITQIGNMSRVLPLLFLLIAGIILYIMLKRLVEQQRGQIGILKAFGYTNTEVLIHYLSYALLMGSIGGLVGGTVGILLATPLTGFLLEFFNVPLVHDGFFLYYLFLGLFLSVGVSLFSGYHGCKNALKLKPAEAMRPETPPLARKALLERVNFLWEMLTIQGKMAVRNLSRNRSRTLFLFLGIMISCSVVAMTWSFIDLIDKMVFYQYEEVETYDAKMTLTAPADRKMVNWELQRFPEVSRAEPLLEAPVTLSQRWLQEDVMLLGLTEKGTLYNILDAEGNRITPSTKGLILSNRLAEKLQASVGTVLELESPLLRNEEATQKIPVADIIPQYLGMNAYMEISGLEEILEQDKITSSVLINVNNLNGENGSHGVSVLRDRYRESDMVSGIDAREERLQMTRELMEAFGSAIYIYVFIGVIICFAIIYSSSFITLSERSRELASMMVLGLSPREVFSVITFEQWFISVFAMIAGLPLANLMQWGFSREMSTDLYSIPADVPAESLFMALLITSLSIWLAQRFAMRKIERLSLIDVLKTRE